MNVGHVCLAGDAAHIHSPLGARGMNLGVEDACVYARLAAAGQLDEYQQQRLPIVQSVVRWVGRTTEIPRGRTFASRMVRTFPGLVKLVAPLGASSMRRWLACNRWEIRRLWE